MFSIHSFSKHAILIVCLDLLCGVAATNAEVTGSGDVDPADPSTWDMDTHAYIGYSDWGRLAIADGDAVFSVVDYIGALPGSTGEVAIDGTGSTWTTCEIYIGDQGNGTLDITNGARLNSACGSIGVASGSTGVVKVDGPGSMWADSEEVTAGIGVGQNGNGTLQITNGGAFTTIILAIGCFAESTGMVTVDGAGSTCAIGKMGGFLDVGLGGNGTLNITSGGLVSVAKLSIDYDEDGRDHINMALGGMLALYGQADASLADFLGLIDGTDSIRYWDDSISEWSNITGATYGQDYTLNYMTEGDLMGYTVLTVFTPAPEPASLSLLALGGLALTRRRRLA